MRPLSHVNKCPTHRHLVWDISQCIYFYGYNTQTFHLSRYQQAYVGRIIELQLIYPLLYLFHSDRQVEWFVLVTKTRLHVCQRSKIRNGPTTSQQTPLTSRSYCTVREVHMRVVSYTHCKIFHKHALKTSINH